MIIVGDADSLIALAYKDDPHHRRALKISENLISQSSDIVYPNTAILEAITALKRGLHLPNEAHLLNKRYQAGVFTIKFVDQEIQLQASKRFENAVSKQNTIFDAIVASCAQTLHADGIFSFDAWYEKLGFRLASNLK